MKELLYSLTKKDFRIDTFRSGGPGGQHQNKTNSGVRIVHIASGAVGESRGLRSQHQNKKIALERLVEDPKFKLWNNIKIHEIIEGKTIEKKVEEMMTPENLKIEIQDDGKWTVWEEQVCKDE